jgi:uncharacterized membrane protein YgcG
MQDLRRRCERVWRCEHVSRGLTSAGNNACQRLWQSTAIADLLLFPAAPTFIILSRYFMDLDSARSRGDLSALKRPTSTSKVVVPRVPHPDEAAKTNVSSAEWQKQVLLKKRAAGETLNDVQTAMLERLCGSSLPPLKVPIVVAKKVVSPKRGSGGGGGGGSRNGGGGGGGGKKQQVVKRRIEEGLGGGSGRSGGGGGSGRPLTTAEKMSMSLESLTKKGARR